MLGVTTAASYLVPPHRIRMPLHWISSLQLHGLDEMESSLRHTAADHVLFAGGSRLPSTTQRAFPG